MYQCNESNFEKHIQKSDNTLDLPRVKIGNIVNLYNRTAIDVTAAKLQSSNLSFK